MAEQIQGRVVFTGYINYDNIPIYLRLANVSIIPSIWDDPFPTTVLEAMAAGLPIIATKSGGIIESGGDCALFVSKTSVVCELKEALRILYADTRRCEAMATQGLLISKRYGKMRYALDFYQQL